MPLDLDDASDALEATPPPANDRRALAHHADFWAHNEVSLDPVQATLAFGALPLNARRLVALLVEAAGRSASLARCACASPRGTGAFIGFADTVDWLPAETVASDPTRREELLRRFAAYNEAPIVRAGKPEDPKRSVRVLERLDYRAVAAEEERLERARKVAAAIEEVNRKIRAGGPL